MMTRFQTYFSGLAALIAAVLLCAQPVQANEAEKQVSAPSVQLGAVAIPVVVDGQIANYLYLNVKVHLVSGSDETTLREREPYFRDALIRACYKTSYAVPGHIDQLDEVRFTTDMKAVFTRVAGPNTIKSVEVAVRGARPGHK